MITQHDIADLLNFLKTEIGEEYRASDEDTEPSMQVTVACDDSMEKWSYQTGDNSYTGSCYHYPNWAVIYLYRDSNTSSLALEALNQLTDSVYESIRML